MFAFAWIKERWKTRRLIRWSYGIYSLFVQNAPGYEGASRATGVHVATIYPDQYVRPDFTSEYNWVCLYSRGNNESVTIYRGHSLRAAKDAACKKLRDFPDEKPRPRLGVA